MGAYDPQGREIVLALARVLRHAGHHLRRAAQGEMHGRSGAPAGQRPGCSRRWPRPNIETLQAAKVEKMVSICPHCVRTIGDGLAGVRARRSRSSITANCWRGIRIATAAPRTAAREGGVSRSLLPGPLSRHLRRAARGDRAVRRSGRAARARASGRSAAARAAGRCSWAKRRASA